MKPRKPNRKGFSLLELVVVLAILAVMTTLAMRTVDQVGDQTRYEASARVMENLRAAVLGSPDDRAADGTRTVSGFVADMGRLPRAVAGTDGSLTLAELWVSPGAAFDVRPATVANGLADGDADPQVLVPGGWRGPYLRLPIGTSKLLDGWGNPMETPDASGYARLRDAADNPLSSSGQEIRVIRHLGANAAFDGTGGLGYDREESLEFTAADHEASLSGQVEVMDGDSPAPADALQRVTVRLFGPDPANPSRVRVIKTTAIAFASNPVSFTLAGATIGPRAVRAYLHADGADDASGALKRGTVKHVTLRPGANLLNLTIDR